MAEQNQSSKTTLGKAFKTIIWPRRKYILIGLILIIVSRAASLVLPGSSKILVDEIVPKGDLEMLKWLILTPESDHYSPVRNSRSSIWAYFAEIPEHLAENSSVV